MINIFLNDKNSNTNNANTNNTVEKREIKDLPDMIIKLIESYIPRQFLVFTNKINYNNFHHLIRKSISNYETFVRDVIRRDNAFVFYKITTENYEKWKKIKNYQYKNLIFNNYIYFAMHYCIENDSNNCRNILLNFNQEQGLCKNQHKKNIVKNIRWKG